MNLEKIDNVLKRAAVVLGLMGGAAFTGLYPIWVGVIASFAGVLCGALATSPVFSVTPEAGWNRAMQALAAVFTAAAGSSQLEAVQKFVAPGHPVLAAKLGLGVMLGAQVFAYLAQRGAGAASQSAGPALVLLLALAVGATSCAHANAVIQACRDCATTEGPQVVRDLEHQAGPFVEQLFMCDPGFNPDALPACLTAGLESVVVALGPDGERFRDCVISKLENNPDAPPLARKRASAVRRKLALERARNGR